MEYISAKEAAKRWGIDPSRIGKFARDGRIEGAVIIGRNWLIPANAAKPIDGRTKAAKEASSSAAFRFPLFVNFPENSFVPPLSPEETALRQAQVAFYACEFERAKIAFEPLSQNAKSIYVKICALFYLCVISVIHSANNDLRLYYGHMKELLSEDFPNRQDMQLFLPWFDFCVGRFYDIAEKLEDNDSRAHHGSAMYLCAFLSIFKSSSVKLDKINSQFLEPYITLCQLAERDGYVIEAQKLHLILFIAYYAAGTKEKMRYHLKKALELAYRHNLFYTMADAEGYYANEIEPVLLEYPEVFAAQIRKFGKIIAGGFADFMKRNNSLMYAKLSMNDYRFLIYAEKKYSNKQIAELCGMSERTVANKYNQIYNKLGVNSKKELLREIEHEMGDT